MAVSDTAFESGIKTITHKIVDVLITPIEWLLIGASLVMFFYGLVVFLATSESAKKEDGKRHMLWGLVGLFIIFAVWGVVTIVGDTVNSLR